MKKFGTIMMLVLAAAISFTSCKSTTPMEKARKNQYKSKMAEFKKGGWEVFGTAKSLDVALLEYYEKLEKEGAQELMGVASSFISKNVGKQAAFNSAVVEYANKAKSMIRGRVSTDLFGNATDVPTEFDKFYAAYESMVVKEINGEIEYCFSVIRPVRKDEKGKDIFEMQSYFIVNENEAAKARIRAMESAFKESNMAKEYAEKISNYVRECVPTNE